MTIHEVNAMDRNEFVRTFGSVFEESPWVADQTWNAGPFESADRLCEEMNHVMTSASCERQLVLLRAHPDLGTRAHVSENSASEQAGAGLDRLTQEEYDLLLQRNAAYRQIFGFPFLFAVRGSDKTAVMAALERRLRSTPPQELEEALRNVCRIAQFRIQAIVQRERAAQT